MREYIKFIVENCAQNLFRDFDRLDSHFCEFGLSSGEPTSRTSRVWFHRLAVACLAIAATRRNPCPHEARANNGYSDPQVFDLLRQTLGNIDDGELAGRVGIEAKSAVQTCHRGGVDHVSALTVGADVRQKGSNAMYDPHQVHIEDPSPSIERYFVNATAATGDTGIVANHMNTSERRKCLFGGVLDTPGIGHIADHASRVEAERSEGCYSTC